VYPKFKDLRDESPLRADAISLSLKLL